MYNADDQVTSCVTHMCDWMRTFKSVFGRKPEHDYITNQI